MTIRAYTLVGPGHQASRNRIVTVSGVFCRGQNVENGSAWNPKTPEYFLSKNLERLCQFICQRL